MPSTWDLIKEIFQDTTKAAEKAADKSAKATIKAFEWTGVQINNGIKYINNWMKT